MINRQNEEIKNKKKLEKMEKLMQKDENEKKEEIKYINSEGEMWCGRSKCNGYLSYS